MKRNSKLTIAIAAAVVAVLGTAVYAQEKLLRELYFNDKVRRRCNVFSA
jgi:hypothetical protein